MPFLFAYQLFRPLPGSRSARGLILLLCLATWRGPIPWVHAHGSEDVADAKLERHLLSFHREHLSERFFSWHLHVLLPWERFECEGESESQKLPLDPLAHEGAVVTVLSGAELIGNFSQALATFQGQHLQTPQWAGNESALRSHAPNFSSFIESLLLTAPLCAVLGVALC